MNIIFEWSTGKIEMPIENIVNLSAANLKAMVKAAETNRAEVVETISEYLQSLIDELDPDSKSDKKQIETYENLLVSIGAKKKLTKQEKAIDRIIKNCNREQFSGAMYENGKQFFLDGLRLVRYSSPLDFKPARDTFPAEKTIGDTAQYDTPLVLPNLKELKKSIAIAKKGVESGHVHIKQNGRHKYLFYDFGYGFPMVNAMYLVDMLEALPECEAFCISNNITGAIYFKAGADDGILLPARKTEEYESAPEASEIVSVPAASPEVVEIVNIAPAVAEIVETTKAGKAIEYDDKIAAISESMGTVYETLYSADCGGNLIDYSAAVEAFDDFSKVPENAEFLRLFAEYREDFISSDREAAAFMIAYNSIQADCNCSDSNSSQVDSNQSSGQEFNDIRYTTHATENNTAQYCSRVDTVVSVSSNHIKALLDGKAIANYLYMLPVNSSIAMQNNSKSFSCRFCPSASARGSPASAK